jgi:ribosomal protein S18 acetylase RimI-like enzyme
VAHDPTKIQIDVEDPAGADGQFCLCSYVEELDGRFEGGFDPAVSNPADEQELRPPRGLLLVARLAGEPVGCGALKLHGSDPAEIKRMWVAPGCRGLGLGRRILDELEAHAVRQGVRVLRLETNGTLEEALRLYRRNGYREVPAFNTEPYAHHWFEKTIAAGV